MRQIPATLAVTLLLLTPVAARCAETPARPATDPPPAASSAPAADETMKTTGGTAGGGGDLTRQPAAAKPAGETAPLTGKVLQTMKGGGYTYVLLRKKGSDEQVWLAVPAMSIIVGKEMTFSPGMAMHDFQSKALKRTFETIYFSSGPLEPQAVKKGKKALETSPGSKGGAATAAGKIDVEKVTGPGAYRVADLYRDRDRLNGKKVVVRGKVVKVAAGIMNRNWIHIQDGSGSAKKGTNDLVVTSDTLPAEGEVITATGTLAKDRDFGSNYRYKVIVEKAQIAIE